MLRVKPLDRSCRSHDDDVRTSVRIELCAVRAVASSVYIFASRIELRAFASSKRWEAPPLAALPLEHARGLPVLLCGDVGIEIEIEPSAPGTCRSGSR